MEPNMYNKSSTILLSILHYLLLLLLAYYCILANVTVQADNITFELTGRRKKKKQRNKLLVKQ